MMSKFEVLQKAQSAAEPQQRYAATQSAGKGRICHMLLLSSGGNALYSLSEQWIYCKT